MPTLSAPKPKSPQSNPQPVHWYASGWGVAFIVLLVIVIALIGILAWQVIIFMQNEIDNSSNTNTRPSSLVEESSTNYIVADAPSTGSPAAKVKVVEFGDFQCPYCRQMYQIIRRIQADYGDRIYFEFRDFPVSDIHPEAEKAAEAGRCAFDQSNAMFWALHDKMYQNQEHLAIADLKEYAIQVGLEPVRFDSCLDSGRMAARVAADFQVGLEAGLPGTPTFFINGYQLSGVLPDSVLRQAIDYILAKN
ncbi:MAG: DsbA family protein [Patescibacteria group bacterium]